MKGIKTYQIGLPKEEVVACLQKNIAIDPLFSSWGESISVLIENPEFVGESSDNHFKIKCHYSRKRKTGTPTGLFTPAGPVTLLFYGNISESSNKSTTVKTLFIFNPLFLRLSQVFLSMILLFLIIPFREGISNQDPLFFVAGVFILLMLALTIYRNLKLPKQEIQRLDAFLEKLFPSTIEKHEQIDSLSLEEWNKIDEINQYFYDKNPDKNFSIPRSLKLFIIFIASLLFIAFFFYAIPEFFSVVRFVFG
ncbi:MAG: hypothetical protein AABZ60_12445 [Planctomycetota bacterium]